MPLKEINIFDGENAFLSNFLERIITFDNKKFRTNEHAFQWKKTLNSHEQSLIQNAKTPGQSKREGRNCTLRKDWEQIKKQVMFDIVMAKFSQHQDLKAKLLATGDAILIEGNVWHDNTWGNCTCNRCINIKGQNLLGLILMQVRDLLNK